jgi:hypothetical protein
MISADSDALGRGAAPGIAAGGWVPGRGALLADGKLLRLGVWPGRCAEVVPVPRMRFATAWIVLSR